MLFLLNDVVFELMDLQSILRDGSAPLQPAQYELLTPNHLTALLREAIFVDPNLARNKPDRARFLSALIVYKAPGANALLAVRPDGAESADQVGLRFANVPITTMAYLWKQQTGQPLSPHEVNTEVWNNVSGVLHSAH